MKVILVILIIIMASIVGLLVPSCEAADPLTDTLYLTDVYAEYINADNITADNITIKYLADKVIELEGRIEALEAE